MSRKSTVPLSLGSFFPLPPVLETPSLVLRPFTRRDARDVYAYASDPEVARFVLWDTHTFLADSRAYIRYVRSLYHRGLPYTWAIVLQEESRVIGSIGFVWFSRENASAEVGYSLNRSVWNRGYATEALTAVLRHAFTGLGLRRVEAQCDVRNPASARVMEKSGMLREGILHSRLINKGEFIDVALYATVSSNPLPDPPGAL